MTRTVQLAVSGEMELRGLPLSLASRFTTLRFARPIKIDDTTSAAAPLATPAATPHGALPAVMKLAERLVAECDPGRTGHSFDHLAVVEDLELANRTYDGPRRIAEQLRLALRVVLDERRAEWASNPARYDALCDQLRTRVSFHLLAPMTEAYFFADTDSLAAAGMSAPRCPKLRSPDVEQFLARSPEFDAWSSRPEIPTRKSPAHPKHVLEHALGGLGRYRPSIHGVAALKALRWDVATALPGATRLARSLLDDLAQSAGAPPIAGTHPATRLRLDDPTRLLRNL